MAYSTALMQGKYKAYLDSLIRSTSCEILTVREYLTRKHNDGYFIQYVIVEDTAAMKKINAEFNQLKKSMDFLGNPNLPKHKRYVEIKKMPRCLYDETKISVKKKQVRLVNPNYSHIFTILSPMDIEFINSLTKINEK